MLKNSIDSYNFCGRMCVQNNVSRKSCGPLRHILRATHAFFATYKVDLGIRFRNYLNCITSLTRSNKQAGQQQAGLFENPFLWSGTTTLGEL
jgi:hypothetical protein